MLYRRLGPTGLPVSALALGTWLTFGESIERGVARDLVATAWDAGINLFDSAENYAQGRGETVLGDVIADLRLPRDGYALVGKAMHGSVAEPRPMQRGLTRKHLLDACNASLKRLRTDYLDIFLCHRPDPEVPLVETVAAMDLLVRQGKVLHWGSSEWPADLLMQARALAMQAGMQPPQVEQVRYNLLHRAHVEDELASMANEWGLTTYAPLASGVLSGKYAQSDAPGRLGRAELGWLRERELTEARAAQAARFVEVARTLDAEPAALAIAWCLRNPAVSSVILGASRVEQLRQNLSALALLERVGAEDWARIEGVFAKG